MIHNFQETNIHYNVLGEGETLVLLHGFLHSSKMWEEYIAKWKSQYQIITIDLPGHGKSQSVKDLSIKTIADIVNEILIAENIQKAHIIGHSLGGYTGLAFAEYYPEKLDKFILFHSSAFADTEEVKKKRNLWLKIIDRHPAMFVRNVIEYLYDKALLEEYRAEIDQDIQDAKDVGYEGYIEVIKAMRDRPDRIAILKSDLAIYFVGGKLDKIIPEEISQSQIDMLKNGKGSILEKASHMSFVEDTKNAFNILDAYLKD